MLKRLELIGFKSFADRTRFDFAPGITAIVGPNGSGKSNIVDAVRWLLGEQSAKSLRGTEMTDVIFNGSSTRKSLGMAEVTMTFDNTAKQLDFDADEVQITRRVYRDGQGEYLINGQESRLKDIKELFLGSGAGHGKAVLCRSLACSRLFLCSRERGSRCRLSIALFCPICNSMMRVPSWWQVTGLKFGQSFILVNSARRPGVTDKGHRPNGLAGSIGFLSP